MVGSAIVRHLTQSGINAESLVLKTHQELDLTDQAAVQSFFAREKPDQVYLAAAKVGGIHANNTYPADFIYQNLMMQANVIKAAFQNGVQKLLFLGSSCIYPKLAPQPMTESALLTGPLEPTNEPYAVAKIAGIKLCESYNRQYGGYRACVGGSPYHTQRQSHRGGHNRQMLRKQRMGLGLPRKRAHGWARPLQQQQRLRRTGYQRLPQLILAKHWYCVGQRPCRQRHWWW